MPQQNGTGPQGLGPRTGRGMGRCGGTTLVRGGDGLGRGWGRGFGAGCRGGRGWGQGNGRSEEEGLTKEDLSRRMEGLKAEMDRIEKLLRE